MKRNNLSGEDIANVLRTATDVNNLNQIISNLKIEIEKLKQNKNNYSLHQNMDDDNCVMIRIIVMIKQNVDPSNK